MNRREFIRDVKVHPPELKGLVRKLWNMVPKEERYTDHRGLRFDLDNLSSRIRVRLGATEALPFEKSEEEPKKSLIRGVLSRVGLCWDSYG